jgi:3-hydroxybutyryl-CoA dehydrogenase
VGDARAPRAGLPGNVERLEVEGQVQLVVVAQVGRDELGLTQVDLADDHALARVFVEHGADASQQRVRAVEVVRADDVEVAADDVGRRDVGQRRVLADEVHDVGAEAVDAAIHPEAQHVVHRLDDRGLVPVEVGLLGQEGVQEPLLGGLIPGPRGAAAEGRRPVVRRMVGRAIVPAVPVALGRAARRAALDEPRVLVRGVVGHPVQQHAKVARVGLVDESVEGREVAEERVDVAVVGDVVAEVGHRRAVDGRQPDRVDPEPLQVLEARAQAVEVADAVARRIGERARIDLVDDRLLPPHAAAKATDPRPRGAARVPRMADVAQIGVVGAGFMGSGIAESAARAGVAVKLYEPQAPPLERSRASIEASVARAVKRERLTADEGEALLGRIAWSSDLDALSEAELVVEAIVEDAAVKAKTFRDLDAVVGPATILASNTSSIPIAGLAAATDRPDRVLGLHFFSPVPVMKLVEVVIGLDTAEATVERAAAFAEQIGKTAIKTKDRSGFIVNFLLVPYLMAAVRMYEEGFASREDIDEGMKLGCGHPMGPLTLCDFIGLDVLYSVCDSLYEEFKRDEYAPPPLMKRMVVSGHLGRKTGRGFYEYD